MMSLMEESIDKFKKNVKISFEKAKEDISRLHFKIDQLNYLLGQLNTQNNPSETQIDENESLESIEPVSEPETPQNISSTGNKGVYSFIHSFNKHSFNMHSDIQLFLGKLTKQELLTFLTIYQLEEDKGEGVTYGEISSKIELSEGCIRTYITSLIRKGAPVLKQKYNNRIVYLSIPKEFRDLNIKQVVLDQYYRNDPHQRQLSDSF